MSEYVMVPREPTEAMVSAGMSEIDWCRDEQVQDKFRPFVRLNQDGTTYSGTSPGEDVQDAYRAMIAAAPAPQGIGREEIARVIQQHDNDHVPDGYANGLSDDVSDWSAYLADKVLALLPTEPPAQWQPIETHDASSESVLIAEGDGSVCEARCLDDGRGWWAANNDPTDAWGYGLNPTHWQPLPEPPAQGEG